MTRAKKIALVLLLVASMVPIGTSSQHPNLGVKRRPVGQAVVSNAVDVTPFLVARAYSRVASYKPFVIEAAKRHHVPAITLLAILFEEELHRKPVDVSTFGPAQLGIGELRAQGLPERVELLEDPEISIFLLAAKLDRLRRVHGSLKTAIMLHNGYDDYFTMIEKRQKDPHLLEILIEQTVRQSFIA
jgi:hypothetical protein